MPPVGQGANQAMLDAAELATELAADPGDPDSAIRKYEDAMFTRILCLLLPLGMISELERMNQVVSGAMAGQMVWLAIPLGVLVSWMYLALDQVGESSSNPFEGGANDVPISQICASIEVDLRQLLGESALPARAAQSSPIVL